MYRIIGSDGKEYGPISADQLRQWIRENRANSATPVFVEGSPQWKTLGSLSEFSMLLAAQEHPVTPAVFPTGSYHTQKSSALASTGLVLGIISLCFCCCCHGLPFNVLGLAFSIIALVQIRNEPERYAGRGMAIVGLVLSLLSIAFVLILFILGILGALSDHPSHHVYKL
jgi:hypothetical protein